MHRVSTKATPYALSRRAPLHLQPNATRLKPLRVMVGALRAQRKVKKAAREGGFFCWLDNRLFLIIRGVGITAQGAGALRH